MENQSDSKSLSMFAAYGKIKDLVDAIESAESVGHGMMMDAFIADVECILSDVQGGVDRCVGFVRYAEVENAAIDNEIKRLQDLKKRNERSIDRIKSVARGMMERLHVKSLEGKFDRKFYIHESTAVEVLDMCAIPDELKRVTTSIEPNKQLIKERIKKGESVPGAMLATRKSVQVK